MDTRVERAHSLVEPFMEFSNSFRNGHCKEWKACGILVTVAQIPAITGERLEEYVASCLEMEGFRKEDCNAIAGWVDRKMKDTQNV